MKKIVIDTNVIISAALSPDGIPSKIIWLVAANEDIQLYYSAEILDEYREVLSRPRLNISADKQAAIMNAIEKAGVLIEPTGSTIPLPDEDDRIFYDAAKTCGAVLITGNAKHYPVEAFIVTPSDFIVKNITTAK